MPRFRVFVSAYDIIDVEDAVSQEDAEAQAKDVARQSADWKIDGVDQLED